MSVKGKIGKLFRAVRSNSTHANDQDKVITVKDICRITGIDTSDVSDALLGEKIKSLAVHYSWAEKDGAYFSRYLNENEGNSAIKAHKRGAKVLFTSKQYYDENGFPLPCIVVDDPSELYYKYYAWKKSQLKIPTLAITGSVGKTTTKEMIADVVSKKHKVTKNSGNANSHSAAGRIIDVLTPDVGFYIQEVGAFAPGWIEGGAKMLKPDMCVITNIGYPHVDLYGTIENIFNDKTSLIKYLPSDGVAFLNYDDERLRGIKSEKRIVSFAINNDADYKAENIVNSEGSISFDLHCEEGVFPIEIHMHGEHNVLNALAAFAVGRYMNVPTDDIVKALYDYKSEGLRQNVQNVGGYYLYMDCYNSAPDSIMTSVEALCKMIPEDGCKRIAVLGDIPRLGDMAPQIHKDTGEKLKEIKGIDHFILYGPHSKTMYDVMKDGNTPVLYAENRDALDEAIREIANRGDYILFKAGHPTGLAKSVDRVFGTSFHITDGDVLLEDGRDVSNDDYRARWIDGVIEIRKAKKKEEIRHIPESFDGKTSVVRVGKESFSGGLMVEVFFPNTLYNIGYASFYKCKKLEKVHFGTGLKIIERSAFNGCTALTEIKLPEGTLEIGERAFRDSGLKEILIPDSVGHIYEDAFDGCEDVTIQCHRGSYAESFAKGNGMKVKLL